MNNKKEIFVVLGKELKDDRITLEYKDRIDCLIENLKKMDYLSNTEKQDVKWLSVLFSGGQKIIGHFTEARQGQDYFETKLNNDGLVLPTIDVDLEAKNTPQNIENILKKLDKESKIFLYLISTDYHIQRLKDIRRLLPKNRSLLAKIDRINEESQQIVYYDFLSCRYRYSSHDDEIKKWQAQLYLDSNNFKIMESNLVSIINGESTLSECVIN